jgi:hypothetical protein
MRSESYGFNQRLGALPYQDAARDHHGTGSHQTDGSAKLRSIVYSGFFSFLSKEYHRWCVSRHSPGRYCSGAGSSSSAAGRPDPGSTGWSRLVPDQALAVDRPESHPADRDLSDSRLCGVQPPHDRVLGQQHSRVRPAALKCGGWRRRTGSGRKSGRQRRAGRRHSTGCSSAARQQCWLVPTIGIHHRCQGDGGCCQWCSGPTPATRTGWPR